jgi:colanic acid/amylovoran biosynthesis glycosyltransferase
LPLIFKPFFLKNKLKIAVYSGDIPSTTFIERLIVGLSNADCNIYIFGFLKKKVSYNKSVSLFAYKNNKISKAIFLIKYSLLLFLFKRREKAKLDGLLKLQSKNLLLDKVKCYPVLWHKPDIFHLQWAKGLKDWIWVQEFGIKLVLSLRGAHINYSPIADLQLAKMYRHNFPKVDAFHAVSKAIGKEAEKYNAPKDRIEVIYSGLLLDVKIDAEPKQHKVFQIISVGRTHWKKGYTYTLDACKILKNQNFQFHYTIVGGANDIEFQYQLEDLNLTNEVTLLDNLPYDKVQELMQNSNLFVLPSVEEGIANVVLEAMLNETLVLTTDCGGMTEVIKDGNNGFKVPIRNPKAMATKIIQIESIEEEKIDGIKKNALETIKNTHSEEQMVEAMLKLYQGI